MIKGLKEQLHQIRTHAEQDYPAECCGLLLGSSDNSCKLLREVVPTENSWSPAVVAAQRDTATNTSKRNRFSIAPEVMLQVQKRARDRHLDIIGVYHSHPDGIAVPSEFDRAIAWSVYSYIIVSVTEGRAVEVRCWTLEEGQFQSEEILIIDAETAKS
ncbi:MAG: M67 family metallopeptidase [Cyanophyceae cyanobacterium]